MIMNASIRSFWRSLESYACIVQETLKTTRVLSNIIHPDWEVVGSYDIRTRAGYKSNASSNSSKVIDTRNVVIWMAINRLRFPVEGQWLKCESRFDL